MKLSDHFSLIEFTRSDTAVRRGIDNTPCDEHLANLAKLARKLEEVRALVGHPVVITSGYRSPALNAAVDGSATSSHCHGLAADFHVPGFGPDQAVAQAIADSALDFDQLIFEQTARSTWVHLGIDARMRREVLSWKSGRGYRRGVVRLK